MNHNKTVDVCALGEILIDFTAQPAGADGIVHFAQHPGGAPANVAVGATRLGAKSAMIGKVGDDMHGKLLKDVLIREGVDVRCLIEDQEVFTTLAFVSVDDNGERVFSFARKPGADTQLRYEEIDSELLEEARIFHVGSLSLTHQPSRDATWKAITRARESGAIISYDPNYRASLWPDEQTAIKAMRSLIPMADLMKISDEETELLTGVKDPKEAARILLEQGPKAVAITLGAKGSLIASKEGMARVEGFPGQVADTNGAGDSFWAGMLCQIAQSGKKPEELSLETLKQFTRFANACAGLTVRRPGAIPAMPTRAEVEAFLEEQEQSSEPTVA